MKKTLIALAILGAAWAGSTWYISNETEGYMSHNLDNANDTIKSFIKQIEPEAKDDEIPQFSQKGYEKGLLASKVTYSFKPAESEEEILIPVNINHGPITWRPGAAEGTPFAALGVGYPSIDFSKLDKEATEKLKSLFKDQPPLTGLVAQGFTRDVQYKLALSPLAMTEGSQKFKLDGVQLQGELNPTTKAQQAVVQFPTQLELGELGLQLDNGAVDIDIDSVKLIGNAALLDSQLVLDSNYQLDVPKVSFKVPDLPAPISFALSAKSETAQTDGFYQGQSTTRLKDIETPFLPTSSLTLEMDYAGFPVTAIEKLEALKEQKDTLSEKELQDKIGTIIIEDALVANKTKVNTNLSLNNKLGDAIFNLDLAYLGTPGGEKLTQEYLQNISDPKALLKLIQGKVNFSFDHDIFPMAGLFLDHPAIKQEDKKYLSSLETKGENLVLNGKEMTVEAFMALLQPQASKMPEETEDMGMEEALEPSTDTDTPEVSTQ